MLINTFNDIEERPILARTLSHKAHLISTLNEYTAGGLLKYTKTNISATEGNGGIPTGGISTHTTTSYDHHGRPTDMRLKVGSTLSNETNGSAASEFTLFQTRYDAVGRPQLMTMQGGTQLYKYYDMAGRIKNWFCPYIEQQLLYGEGSSNPSYSGLISGRITTAYSQQRRYDYVYDKLG